MFGLLRSMRGVQRDEERRAHRYRELIRREAKLGGEIFGPIAKGNRREFFCLDEHTWVWHEEWNDQSGHHAVTTRYDVRPNGLFKAQDGQSYQRVSLEEARRLYRAIRLYGQMVDQQLYA
jgi:hypothetical protein